MSANRMRSSDWRRWQRQEFLGHVQIGPPTQSNHDTDCVRWSSFDGHEPHLLVQKIRRKPIALQAVPDKRTKELFNAVSEKFLVVCTCVAKSDRPIVGVARPKNARQIITVVRYCKNDRRTLVGRRRARKVDRMAFMQVGITIDTFLDQLGCIEIDVGTRRRREPSPSVCLHRCLQSNANSRSPCSWFGL